MKPEQIYQYLNMFKAQGGRILLVTHDIYELKLCDKLYVLKDGDLVQYYDKENIQGLVNIMSKSSGYS